MQLLLLIVADDGGIGIAAGSVLQYQQLLPCLAVVLREGQYQRCAGAFMISRKIAHGIISKHQITVLQLHQIQTAVVVGQTTLVGGAPGTAVILGIAAEDGRAGKLEKC